MKPRRRKTTKLKSRKGASARRRTAAAGQETEVARLARELQEAHEQQAATSQVLRVISSSSGELAPVFESLLASAIHLCGAEFGIILLREGDGFRTVALRGATAEYTEARWRAPFFRPAAERRSLRALIASSGARIRLTCRYKHRPSMCLRST